MDWLNSINRERIVTRRSALEHCLLAADNDIFRVPWEDVVQPEFISRPPKVPEPGGSKLLQREFEEKTSTNSGLCRDETFDDLHCRIFIETSTDQSVKMNCQNNGVTKPPVSAISVASSVPTSTSTAEDSEGEYVELADITLPRFSPQKGSLTQAISMNYKNLHKPRSTESTPAKGSGGCLKNGACSQSMVCARLIEENLSETLQPVTLTRISSAPHSPDQQVKEPEPAFATGTAFSDSLSENNTDTKPLDESVHISQLSPASKCSLQLESNSQLDGELKPNDTLKLESNSFTESLCHQSNIVDGSSQQHDVKTAQTDTKLVALDSKLKETMPLQGEESQTSQTDCEIVVSRKDEPLLLSRTDENQSSTVQPSKVLLSTLASESSENSCTFKDTTSGSLSELHGRVDTHLKESCEPDDSALSVNLPVAINHSFERQTEQTNVLYDVQTHTSPKPEQDQTVSEELLVQNHTGDEISQTLNCFKHDIDALCSRTADEEQGTLLDSPQEEQVDADIAVPGVDPVTQISQGRVRTKPCKDENNQTEEEFPECLTIEAKEDRNVESGLPCLETGKEEEANVEVMDIKAISRAEEVETAHAGLVDCSPKSDCTAINLPVQEEGNSSEGADKEQQTNGGENREISESVDGVGRPVLAREQVGYSGNGVESVSTQVLDPSDGYAEDTLVKDEHTPAMEQDGQNGKEEEEENGEKEERQEDSLTSFQNGSSAERQGGMMFHYHQQEVEVSRQDVDNIDSHCSTASLLVEDQKDDQLSVPSPLPSISKNNQSSLSNTQDINSEVFQSGVLCLPGARDKSGRALVTVTMRNTTWLNPNCNSEELVRILVYFYMSLRREVGSLGFTVLVDARRCSPVPALFKAFNIFQDTIPGSLHVVLVLADRDLRLEKTSSFQVEMLTSLKSLYKHVDIAQLPTEFDGSFPYSHSSWICFRMRLDHVTSHCEAAVKLLQNNISQLESTVLPSTGEEAESLLCRNRRLMRSILEDDRLVRLQLEGGASLSRLRKEETSVSLTADYRDAVNKATHLYNQVDELVHKLVMLSNKCTQELEFVMEFEPLEAGFKEVSQWIDEVGECRLQSLSELEDSLEKLHQKQTLFREFYMDAYEHCKNGDALLKRLEKWEDIASSELQVYRVKVRSFCVHLDDFSQRVESTKDKINKTVRLYEFFDKAYEWALEGMRHLASVSMEDCGMAEKCQNVIASLETYHSQHLPIPDVHFQEMKDLAGELKSEQGLKQWKFAWSKCQETKQMFEKKLEMALRTRRESDSKSTTGGFSHRNSECNGKPQERSGSISFSCRKAFCRGWGRDRDRLSSNSITSSTPSSPAGFRQDSRDSVRLQTGSSYIAEHRNLFSTPVRSHTLTRSASTDQCPQHQTCSSMSPSLASVEPNRRILRKTQSFDTPGSENISRYGSCQRTLSEPVRRGNTGVFIKGLEVSSTEVIDRPYSPRLPPMHGCSPLEAPHSGSPAAETCSKGGKLRHIVDEMVTTEQEYVRSLRYIIDNYFPEMERPDLPQDLRGKRSIIFGNTEKLFDFHDQYFLKELESCSNHPLRVSHCFLRHQDQFSLYALYSKNKPKSDTLLASHGNCFFRHKQLELGDKMNLASYLLKPIQRMSKYALLLKDLIKEVNEVEEQELAYLHAAMEMVKFQLRHGNDLLAMDDIRDCDVNLKEQGQLVRQDEFTVWYGRKKCKRHVFLFEDLVLFSKPKRIEGGLDVFIYKHSFKTADVGMTETSGDSGLRFEIWFRRRTSKNQNYILQAGTSDIKHAWTCDIGRILWQQATRNKENRMQEMVSMGVGNKPFLDIKPSDAAISDRAIDYIMKGRGARTRASIAVSLFDHSNPFKRAAVNTPVNGPPVAGGPSSSTLLGPLNLHMYSNQSLLAGERPLISPCIEEDELEHETSSQPSMTTESSGSSSHCLSGSGSSGSDSGCVSSHLTEALSEEPSSPHDSTFTSPTLEKPCYNSQYISAAAAQMIGPSTIV